MFAAAFKEPHTQITYIKLKIIWTTIYLDISRSSYDLRWASFEKSANKKWNLFSFSQLTIHSGRKIKKAHPKLMNKK